MEINNDEITKKCSVPGCNYTQLFTSGTDFPYEAWLKCPACGEFVVDESKEKK